MSGAETFRVEDTVHRILRAYGVKCEVFAIPNSISISLEADTGKPLMIMRRIGFHGNDLEKLEKLKQDLNDGDVWDPDKALWEHERLDLLEWAVLQLPERYYEFLMLKYIHGFGKEELAEALGVKVTSLPMLQKRTVGLLRRLIREEDVAHAR